MFYWCYLYLFTSHGVQHDFSTQFFSGVRVTRSLVLCVWFVDRCLSFCNISFGHCVVCSSVYGFWLPLWYLVTIVLSVLRYAGSDYPFGILWPLCCLFFGMRVLIIPLVSCGHCVVCSSICGFWLPLWYLQTLLVLFPLAIGLSVLLR